MRIAIQTLGTRGDVQPYVALGKGLQRAGFTVSLATAPQFESLVSRHGLSFAPLPGDITDLLQTPHGKAAVSGRNKLTATLRLLREVRPMFRRLVEAQWAAARGADAIVYHPKAVGGVHIAEKLGIPAFLALPLPGLSPTGEFPTPLLPFANLGPLNRVSHQLVARYGDLAFRKAVRRWRSEFLGLPSGGNWLTLRGAPVTKLYAYSPAVVSIPADWDATSIVTGYWFLDEASNWHAPKALGAFLESGPPPVYVGFGSLPSEDARKMTDIVLDALAQSGQRGVLATGWGGLRVSERPDHAFFIEAAPHDWLFPRVAAVVHHGGAERPPRA
jgi:UDP:flavonoid glycosyltransferase YjiC (YdhE family)